MRTDPADPVGPDEWQEAVDLASFGLLLDAARQYGLVEGGPEFDLDRCDAILRRAARHGLAYPASPEELAARYVPELMAVDELERRRLARRRIV